MKRFLSMIGIFVLLFNTVAFADLELDNGNNNNELIEEETIEVTVRIEGADSTIFKETELEVSDIDLSIYAGDGYGICNTEVADGVTALHALVEAIEEWLLTEGEMEEADETTVASMLYMNEGYMSMLMGYADEYDDDFSGGNSWMYLYNDEMSSNGIASQVLSDGDELVFYYGYWSFRDNEYETTKISHFKNKYLEVEQDEEFNLTLLSGEDVIDDAIITLTNGNEVDYINNEDGTYTLSFDKTGIYELTALTLDAYGISRPYCKITVIEKEIERDFEAEWGTRRGALNGITNTLTPRSANEMKEAWSQKITSSWTYTAPIIAEEYIYTAAGSSLYKIDKVDGEIISEVKLSNSINSVESLTYGDGMIFVPESNGIIEAYDALTLDLLWTSPKATVGTQSLTSVLYEDGFVYSGTYGKDGGAYYCIDVENPDEFVWEFIEDGVSYYWACPVIVEDAIIFGSDGGTLYSLNKKTGKVIDTYLADGNIRSGVVYEEDTGYLYFTTQNASIYKILLKNNGKFNSKKLKNNIICEGAISSTSTPIIYNGRIYVGANGEEKVISVIDSKTLENIYIIPMRAYPQCSMLLSTGYEKINNKIYIYSTYNSIPGGITVIEDFQGNTTPIVSDLYLPEKEQYCICSVIADSEGNLYYKNDSGNLFKISKKKLENTAITISVIPYDADIKVTDAEENVITPVLIGSYELKEGTYTYEVSKNGYKTKKGTFDVITSDEIKVISVSLSKKVSDSSSTENNEITVSFKMLGDELHGEDKEHTYKKDSSELPVWVEKTKVTVEKGATVLDLLDELSEQYGFNYDEEQYGYISGIQSPDGDWLYEMDNGEKSGWMYRVDGKIILSGVREYKLKKGDNIVWYYTDNYTLEENRKNFGSGSSKKVEEEEKIVTKVIKLDEDIADINKVFIEVTDKDGKKTLLWNVVYDDAIGGFSVKTDSKSEIKLCIFEVDDIEHWGYKGLVFCLAREIISCDLSDITKEIKATDVRKVQEMFGIKTLIEGEESLTREKMMFELAKCVNLLPNTIIDDNIKFTDDLEIEDEYKESIYLLKTIGVISGVGNNRFIPKKNATFAEFSSVIKQIIEYNAI